jgi:hypothetical protein
MCGYKVHVVHRERRSEEAPVASVCAVRDLEKKKCAAALFPLAALRDARMAAGGDKLYGPFLAVPLRIASVQWTHPFGFFR